MLLPIAAVALLCLAGSAYTKDHNGTVSDQPRWCSAEQTTCGLYEDDGPWMAMVQQWALTGSEHSGRQGRIMALPPAEGYYVTDRVDRPYLSPPPPPPPAPMKQANHPSHSGPQLPPGARPYDEWQHSPPLPPTTGKIVNRPPNPYKDKFKPSYPAPVQNQPIPVHSQALDRVDENKATPQKQVSETDLYLLGAIEKLVYRADLFEKRLRKMEETVHSLIAGLDAKLGNKAEPCPKNFTRVGSGCYHVSSEVANWKGASYGCRRLKGNMLEIDNDQERDQLTSALFTDKRYKGVDFWTGGLNPGLLWIWSHSARPVVGNSTGPAPAGEGRCLAWVYDPARASYLYRGHDCALRHRYICEKEEDPEKLSNEVERLARSLREGRKPKILWTEHEP
ncbi:hypothetical protein HW555_006950 [Spodoptera exigua]|uniref:C-type lectin domain-containing protein n=1 Tax=Spodoptera exigua TaxID=7107 RepID=A0A835GI05_SPOEX|nr:hypothetical protein HW555_006950 [Spodoptera exigua]